MPTSSFHRRLAKIESAIVRIARNNPTQNLTGWPRDKISEAVDAAIDPAYEELVEKIAGHVKALAAIPWQNQSTKEKYLTDDGKEQPTPHYFLYWLWGLKIGSWHLPKRIPREVLEGFDRLYGAVLFRCEDCLTGLGNGRGRHYETCPVCRGANLSVKKLSGPPWDKHWEYTPLTWR